MSPTLSYIPHIDFYSWSLSLDMWSPLAVSAAKNSPGSVTNAMLVASNGPELGRVQLALFVVHVLYEAPRATEIQLL